MTGATWLENLGTWCLQITALVLAGGLLQWIARVRMARVKLGYFQILLAGCLLLPIVQPWKHRAAAGAEEITSTSVPIAATRAPAHTRLAWPETVFLFLVVTTALRLVWLALGFARLKAYRRDSKPLVPRAHDIDALCGRIGVQADILVSPRITGPVTFGIRKPVILLPACFRELELHVQRAVLCHELLHVRRRDWLFTAIEEFIRAIFWFHPAVWWLLGQIQLAREQAVDREVVSLMDSDFSKARERYLEALLAVAGAKAQLDLAPAPLFLKKRHLRQRVAHLLKEFSMSKQRMIVSMLTFSGVLFVTGWIAIRSFPLQGAPQVTVQQGDSNLLHRAPVEYPAEAREKKIEGQVVLGLNIDEKGRVSDAHVISGPEELRRAALLSVLQWHYAPGQTPAKTQVTIDFRLPVNDAAQQGTVAGQLAPQSPGELGTLKRLETGGLSEAAKTDLLNRLSLRVGDPITTETWQRIKQIVRETDEHLAVGYRIDASDHSVVLGISLLDSNAGMLEGNARVETRMRELQEKMMREKASGATSGAAPERIRVGGSVQAMNLIKKTPPVYPPLAKQARIQGMVRLIAVIGRDGSVQNLEVVSGHPLLIPAALEAVKEWVYKPTLLNGQPVEVMTQIDVSFTLSE